MSELLGKINDAIAALSEIRESLQTRGASAAHDQELAQSLSLDMLKDFKGKLDHVRHLIWPYLVALEQGSPENVDYALQMYRMQRVREMVNAIRDDEEAVQNDAKTQLFMAELHRLTERPKLRPDA